MESSQIAGIAALYAVVELFKWLWTASKNADTERHIKDLWDWHNQTDDEGRKIWYVPKHLHIEQEKMVEMMRNINENQKDTARVLKAILNQIKDLSTDR